MECTQLAPYGIRTPGRRHYFSRPLNICWSFLTVMPSARARRSARDQISSGPRIRRDYAMLDLDPSASPAEVQQAYRDLVKVWHPDRFAHDSRLQSKAHVKLQAFNDAYARLGKRQS